MALHSLAFVEYNLPGIRSRIMNIEKTYLKICKSVKCRSFYETESGRNMKPNVEEDFFISILNQSLENKFDFRLMIFSWSIGFNKTSLTRGWFFTNSISSSF